MRKNFRADSILVGETASANALRQETAWRILQQERESHVAAMSAPRKEDYLWGPRD